MISRNAAELAALYLCSGGLAATLGVLFLQRETKGILPDTKSVKEQDHARELGLKPGKLRLEDTDKLFVLRNFAREKELKKKAAEKAKGEVS